MRCTRRARALVGGMLVSALLATAGTTPAGAAETTEPAAESTGCRYGTWPQHVNGQPAGFQAGTAAGIYLWHTDTGWHVRVTHPGDGKVVFRGTITSPSPIRAVERRTESSDAVVTVGRHKVGFRFANYGRIDGLDFRVACGAGFSVNGTVNGQPLSPDQVFIGAGANHPPQVPFRIARQPRT